MTLDKIDLIDRKFATSLLGYKRDDVDGVVAEAAATIGLLAEEKMALARQVEELRREVSGYQAREATLRDTLLTTQTIVEDVKAKAHREAESLLDEARDQAEALVQEARRQAVALAGHIDTLSRRKAVLASRFREMLLAALDVLDADQAADAADTADAAASALVAVFADAPAPDATPSSAAVAAAPESPAAPATEPEAEERA